MCSHNHLPLQFVDVVLGSIAFRLNRRHLGKSNRTKAKTELYKHINKKIREIYPNFNIGKSTGKKDDFTNLWKHPYRHWEFSPRDGKPKD